MEQLAGLDAAFLYCETPTTHLHVCGLIVLDPSTMPSGYSYEQIHSVLMNRLPTIPAVHQKLAASPFNLSRPFWIDEPILDLDRHIHRVVLDPPGDDRSLSEVIGDIASTPLKRDRPLWEIWVIEGLASGCVAMLVKMHHSTIDGVSGASMLGHLLDVEAGSPTKNADAEASYGEPTPSRFELLRRSLGTRLAEPAELFRLFPETAFRIATAIWRFGPLGKDAGPTATPFTAPRTLFNATITGRRSIAFTDVPLSQVKRVKDAFGVTVNDVVTAVVGGALRHYLEDRGELPERSLIAAAPVSVHDQTAELTGMTKLSVMFSTLATDESSPVDRLRSIASANARAKEINKMVGADTLMRWAGHLWPNSFALGARLYSTLHLADRHPVVHNLILSNVPGPPFPLFMAGARVTGLYPLGPITDGAGLNVTVLSAEDRVGFGIITCPDLLPQVWDLVGGIRDALNDLSEAAALLDGPEAAALLDGPPAGPSVSPFPKRQPSGDATRTHRERLSYQKRA